MSVWVFVPFSRKMMRRAIGVWPIVLFAILRWLVGIKFEVRGADNIPDRSVIFAVKHQSVWETIYFLWHHPDTAYIQKSELARIPLWGWYMRYCQHIMVDRKGGLTAMRNMIRETKRALDGNRSVVIFPEGTRIPPGQTGTYHPGVAALYAQTGAPVVPVAVNSGIFWPRRAYQKNPGTIILEFLPPMQENLKRKEFLNQLENRVEAATRRLESEADNARNSK